jgi:hypothetical protein
MTLVLSICLAITAIVLAWGAKIIRVAYKHHDDNLTRLWVKYEDIHSCYRNLSSLLHAGVAIDVGLKDAGWLILCCRVAGHDRVQIQNLKPEMTMKEYKELIERLSYDCQHVAYIDAPHGMEQFLKKLPEFVRDKPLPSKVDLSGRMPPVGDQGELGASAAFAVAAAAEFDQCCKRDYNHDGDCDHHPEKK